MLRFIEYILDIKKSSNIFGVYIYIINYIIDKVFCLFMLGRLDIGIKHDTRIRGIKNIKIGTKFVSGKGLWLEAIDNNYNKITKASNPELKIGNKVSLGEYVHIGCNHRIVIGDDVLMGSKIYITDHNHGVYRGADQDSPEIPPIDRKLTVCESVEIGARCWIGEFVTILPGVTIGEGCIIGSHSTVTHDIPANSIAVGSPARVVKKWNASVGQWLKV